MKILYQDDEIVAVQKASGEISQEAPNPNVSLPHLLMQELNCRVFPVHRLDRETGGVMVFAKTERAARGLCTLFAQGDVEKEYWAVTRTVPEQDEGCLEDLLFFDRGQNKVFCVKRSRKGTRKARLSYRVKACAEGYCLIRVFPETGRTHQIRVQFASRKMPLVGDRKYGGTGAGFGLYCHRMTLMHPVSGEKMSFSAEPPEGEMPWCIFLPKTGA